MSASGQDASLVTSTHSPHIAAIRDFSRHRDVCHAENHSRVGPVSAAQSDLHLLSIKPATVQAVPA